MIGQRFMRLVVIAKSRVERCGTYWDCLCDCGNKKTIFGPSLTRGKSKSCGCLSSELSSQRRTTHGHSHTAIYSIWIGMRDRCNNQNSAAYQDYGARGIRVCDRWEQSFDAFYSDMGPSQPGMTIERIDNDKGYSPENCRWATKKEQAYNRRSNKRYTINGHTKTLTELANEYGIDYWRLRSRVTRLGWKIERALELTNKD